MQIRYEVDSDLGLVYARPTTTFSVESLREHLRAIAEDTTIESNFSEILDLTDTTKCDATVPELYGFVEILQIHPNRLRRLAIACREPVMLARFQLVQDFAKNLPLEIGVFKELVSAGAWTGIGADAVERAAVAGRA